MFRKTAKRVLGALLGIVMALLVVTPAYAATITVDDADEGTTYVAYKLFDVSTAQSGEPAVVSGYSYTTTNENLVETLDDYGVVFQESPAGGLWYVTSVNETTLTQYLNGLEDEALGQLLTTHYQGTVAQGATSVDINVGDDTGYYFVTSTMGSLCMLKTAADDVTIYEKNQEPTVIKSITNEAKDGSVQIGDVISFEAKITYPAMVDSVTFHDTLSSNLTLDTGSVKVRVDHGPATSVENVTTTSVEGGNSFSIDLSSYKVAVGQCTVYVTYDAVVNSEASFTTPLTNDAYVTYGSDTSEHSKTTTNTHKLVIKKVDSTSYVALNGAEFQMKDSSGNDVYFVAVNGSDGQFDHYRVATSSSEEGATKTIVVNGEVTVDGLDAEKYTLTETKAPDGYNLLTTSKEVNVSSDNDTVETVSNSKGSELPSTGGMGTTALYVVGGALVIGAGITLVVRRRMSAEA